MSAAVALAKRLVEKPGTDFLVAEIETDDSDLCCFSIALLSEWAKRCDEIKEGNPALTERDIAILDNAQIVCQSILTGLECEFHAKGSVSEFVLCSDGEESFFSAASIDKDVKYLDPEETKGIIGLLELVTNPDHLPLSVHPHRIKGASFAVVQKVEDIAKGLGCLGVGLHCLDTSKDFYERCGYVEVCPEKMGLNFMVKLWDPLVCSKKVA
jgi:hypothetical protein